MKRSESFFSSSASSFTSNPLLASTFSKIKPMSPSTCEIVETFIEFLQSGHKELSHNLQEVHDKFRELSEIITQIIEMEQNEIDVYLLSLFESLGTALVDILGKNSNALNTAYFLQETSIFNIKAEEETLSTNTTSLMCENKRKENLSHSKELQAREIICSIIFVLFTCDCKQTFVNVALNMEESNQKILMEIIEKEALNFEHSQKCIEIASENTPTIFKYIHKSRDSNDGIDIDVTLNKSLSNEAFQNTSLLAKEDKSQEPGVTELINRVLNLEEENEELHEKLNMTRISNSSFQKESKEFEKNIRELKDLNKELTEKLSEEIFQKDKMEKDFTKEMQNRERKWQSRLKVLEKNRQQQISELMELNQILNKQFEDKIEEYEEKIDMKREKIMNLEESLEISDHSLKISEANFKELSQKFKVISDECEEKDKQVTELEILKDELSAEISILSSRLEDMRLLLINEVEKYGGKKIKDNTNLAVGCLNGENCHGCQSCEGIRHFEYALGTNEWRNESCISRFQKLNKNLELGNNKVSGESWFNESFMSNNKLPQTEHNVGNRVSSRMSAEWTQLNINKHYSEYIVHLQEKISGLNREIEFLKENAKKTRDLKYENSKIIQSLVEHETYRGEENEIIVGCLYELREKIDQKNFGKIKSFGENILTDKINKVYQELKSDREMRADLGFNSRQNNFKEKEFENYEFNDQSSNGAKTDKQTNNFYAFEKNNEEKRVRQSHRQSIRNLKIESMNKTDQNILTYFKSPNGKNESTKGAISIPRLNL